jgi:ribonuclease HI
VVALLTNKYVIFDPSITCKGTLADCFRVFTESEEITPIPASQTLMRGSYLTNNKVEVYTDRECMNNGKADASCRSGIWFGPNHHLNTMLKVPGPGQSNQIGELAAVIKVAELTPNYYELSIVSDSKYIIKGLTKHLPEWEDRGWIGVKNTGMFKRAAFLLKSRTAPTTFKWVKGHNGTLGNEESDALAKEGAMRNQPDNLALDVPASFNLQGAKLAAMTQAITYRGITAQQRTQPRMAAQLNLEQTRIALKEYQGTLETDKSIWQGLRRHTIHLRAQQFLYKAMHNMLMVGGVWANILGYEERGTCRICNTTESMNHILTECKAEPRKVIWELAKQTWPHNQTNWLAISLGIILGSGCLIPLEEPLENRDKRQWLIKRKGAKRLLQILISEAAHLIWVLRCEQVIQQHTHSTSEIEVRWRKVVNWPRNWQLSDSQMTR